MNFRLTMVGVMMLAAVEAQAIGWLDTGISPVHPLSNERSSEPDAFAYNFFDAQAKVTNVWTPVRVGIGGSMNSFTNCVYSLPYVWSNVYGVQVELLSCACDVYGVQASLAGAGSLVYGVQASLGNYVTADMYGIQAGAAFSVARCMTGVQVGGWCAMADEACGLQAGLLATGARTEMTGLQLAVLVNTAGICDGLQIGLVNMAESGTVVQIGLWNTYGKADDRYMFPIVNAGW